MIVLSFLYYLFFVCLAEEDHMTVHGHYMHPATTNDINNPGVEYHGGRIGGSRMGSVLGSLHGSVCGGSVRGSPSPLMAPVSMMHSGGGHPPEISQ